nr:hypothetical protein [Escherichia coli]
MKLATDLVNAVLIKNGIVPTSINELPVTSLVKAIDTSASQPVSEKQRIYLSSSLTTLSL